MKSRCMAHHEWKGYWYSGTNWLGIILVHIVLAGLKDNFQQASFVNQFALLESQSSKLASADLQMRILLGRD